MRDSGVTNSGIPVFSTGRQYTDFSPNLKVSYFSYSCYQLDALPVGEFVLLSMDPPGNYDPTPPAVRATTTDPYVQVWASTGSIHTRLYSWSAWVENENIHIAKSTPVIGSDKVSIGELPLTQEDIKTIITSDKLTVFVTSTTGVDEFEIPMMGAATNIAATRAQCTQAAAAN